MVDPKRPESPSKARAAVVLSGALVRTGPLKRLAHAKVTLVTATVDVQGDLFDITVLGDKAVAVSQARKGSQFVATGKLRVTRWKTADNREHQALTVEVTHVELAPPKKRERFQ